MGIALYQRLKVHHHKFTGKIEKVTIDLKEMKTAEKAQENKLRAEAAHRKALSDQLI